jgi:hypothetical protein
MGLKQAQTVAAIQEKSLTHTMKPKSRNDLSRAVEHLLKDAHTGW